jgi:hypothetical protein
MKNVIQPDGVMERDLETYLAGFQEIAAKNVRNSLDLEPALPR